jgi:hypothetical protein
MRIALVSLLVMVSMLCFGQKVYRCEYAETMSIQMSDSARMQFKNQMRNQLLSQGLDSAIADQVLTQLPIDNMTNKYTREIKAGPDSTLVFIQPSEAKGNINFNLKEERLLITKGIFYKYDFATATWELSAQNKSATPFSKTGRAKKILNYDCEEYVNTDNTRIVWITAALPACINPGIKVGDTPGAILAFELKGSGPTISGEIRQLKN